MNHKDNHQRNADTATATHVTMATDPSTIAAMARPAPRSPERVICSRANQPNGSAIGETSSPSANASTAVTFRRGMGVDSVTPSLYPPALMTSVPTPKLGRT
ncbi:MAG: hypothetical protein RLZZ587_106 [Actinomycetota bacterium]